MPEPAKGYMFGQQKANRLSQLADSMPGSSTGAPQQVSNGVGLWVMKALTAITPCVVTTDPGTGDTTVTPGTGLAAIHYRDPATNTIEPGPGPLSGTVYNLTLKEAIAAGTLFYGFRDLAGSLWVVSLLHPGQCVNVVTDVQFNVTTCQLVVCTRQICFPPGVVIGMEDCGGGSGSGAGMGGA